MDDKSDIVTMKSSSFSDPNTHSSTLESPDRDLVRSGVPGLDEILHGGLPRGYLYLIEGNPGTGKTTLGLQFLLEGIRKGERVMYVTLSESRRGTQASRFVHTAGRIESLVICEMVPTGGGPETGSAVHRLPSFGGGAR